MVFFIIFLKTIALNYSVIGIGYLFSRVTPLNKSPLLKDLGLLGCLGLLALAGFTLIWNIFFPLYKTLAEAIFILGVFGFLFLLIQQFKMKSKQFFASTLMVALISVALAGASLFEGVHYDTGLYHLQTIQWVTSSNVPIGIANFWGVLSYNSLWTLICAAIKIPADPYSAMFLMNAAMATFLILSLGQGLIGKKNTKLSFSTLFAFLVIIFLLTKGKGLILGQMGSPSQDFAPAAAAILAVFWGLRFLENYKNNESNDQLMHFLWVHLAMTFLSIGSKLSYIFLGVWGLYFFFISRHLLKKEILLWWAGGWAIYFFRNLLLSGCLISLEPKSCIGFLPWTVPSEQSRSTAHAIELFSKFRGFPEDENYALFAWMNVWWGDLNQRYTFFIPLLTIAICALGFLIFQALYLRLIKKTKAVFDINLFILGLFLFFGIVLWFVKAPDLRFAFGLWVTLSFLLLTVALKDLFKNRIMVLVLIWLAMGAFLIFLFRGIYLNSPYFRFSNEFSWPSLPSHVEVRRVQNEKQVYAYTPIANDQCWDHKIPCAPFGMSLNPRLELKNFGMWSVYIID